MTVRGGCRRVSQTRSGRPPRLPSLPPALTMLVITWRSATARERLVFARWLVRHGLRELPPEGGA